jgi:hypothetical protein
MKSFMHVWERVACAAENASSKPGMGSLEL